MNAYANSIFNLILYICKLTNVVTEPIRTNAAKHCCHEMIPVKKMMPEQQSNGFYAVCCCLSVHLFVVLIKCFFYNGVKLPKMSDRWGSSIFHMEETPSFGKMLNNILQFNLKFWKKAICIMYCIILKINTSCKKVR